jgi:hypothetical protein
VEALERHLNEIRPDHIKTRISNVEMTANGLCDVKWRAGLGADLPGATLSIVLLRMHLSIFGSEEPPQSEQH